MKVNKSKLFKIAHSIFRKGQVATFAEALQKAWKAIKVYTEMLTGTVTFTFRKVNGEIRNAVGTLCDIDYQSKGSQSQEYKDRNADVICYFDMEKNAFRSFKAVTLI